MISPLTAEQIIALAPDPGSVKSGRELATPRKWPTLGCQASKSVVWGECQGSGSSPYRTQIDLTEPAFRCTCPSRKFPCKHGIGLFLLLADQPGRFTEAAAPAWVVDWLDTRAQRAQKTKQPPSEKALGKEQQGAAGPESQPSRQEPKQNRRSEQREKRVRLGLQELETWLDDLVRNGLASAQTQPFTYWERTAARLVDAQAPGAARLVKEMAAIAQSGDAWAERMLAAVGRLHLLLEGYRRIDSLPPQTQADIRTLLGWTLNQDELLAEAGVRDRWVVLGQRVEDEDRLKVKRTWLWGEESGQWALVLHFAHGKDPLDVSLAPGTIVEATLVFYEGSGPKRALVKDKHGPPKPLGAMPGKGLLAAIEAYSRAQTTNPWLERFPFSLAEVIPVRQDAGNGRNGWAVRDAQGHTLPLASHPDGWWPLLALSGGRPISIFGEWNGAYLLPLSAWSGTFVQF